MGFSIGTDQVRRFAPGFSPIIGFANPDHPDLTALDPFCQPGEELYCGGWDEGGPKGWRLEEESTVLQMVLENELPPSTRMVPTIELGTGHIPQMLELTTQTQPGPFGPRTIELGMYRGILHAGRLVAMAGERFETGRFREISAVCTHPDHRGQGLARHLVAELARLQKARGQIPFLHVLADNLGARGLYQSLGFRIVRELPVRVIQYLGR
jgi:ribosomal protein S18 acetylase RimI-like enzyme